jgi:hypothetical protein
VVLFRDLIFTILEAPDLVDTRISTAVPLRDHDQRLSVLPVRLPLSLNDDQLTVPAIPEAANPQLLLG